MYDWGEAVVKLSVFRHGRAYYNNGTQYKGSAVLENYKAAQCRLP